MTANSLRSAPIVIIATDTEATIILSALEQYRGCFGGVLEMYKKMLDKEGTDPDLVSAIKNDMKAEEESIEVARKMAKKISDALIDDYAAEARP